MIVKMLILFTVLSSTFKRSNYFGPTKLFSDLYLAKFLNTSAKSFFSCRKILKLFIKESSVTAVASIH